jgi:hypothetical protein
MSNRRLVTKEEFYAFVAVYPRPLETDVVRFCEPPVKTWNDFTLGNWPQSVVASCTLPMGGPKGTIYDNEEGDWQILEE